MANININQDAIAFSDHGEECNTFNPKLTFSYDDALKKIFDFIGAHVDSFYNFIKQEHPQIIALSLTCLKPNKAAIILENLPHELQSNVIQRIALMGKVKYEVIRCLAKSFEKKLMYSEMYRYTGGIKVVSAIIQKISRKSKKQIIENLKDEYPELANDVKRRSTYVCI